MTTTTSVTTLRVRVLDWYGNRMNGAHVLPVLTADGATYAVRDDLVIEKDVGSRVPIKLHAGPDEGIDGIDPVYLDDAYRECRVFAVTDATEPTPYGDVPVAVPVLDFQHPVRREGGEIAVAIGLAHRMLVDAAYREGVTTDYRAAAGSPLAPTLPERPSWVVLDEMVVGERPLCEGYKDAPCGHPVEVIWRDQLGTGWSCAWHWPALMALRPTPVVFGVWDGTSWVTWRQQGEWGLWTLACSGFAAVVDSKPGRPVLAYEDRPALCAAVYSQLDHNQAAVLWAVGLTHPGCETDLLVPFTESAFGYPRTEDMCWLGLDSIGDRLVERGDKANEVGDSETAMAAWFGSVRAAQSPVGMHRVGSVYYEAGDRASAYEWWLRSAQLGYVHSQVALGVLLAQSGQVVQATPWFERAAAKGSTSAMTNLANLAHERGNMVGARYWLTQAADAGDIDAALILQRLPRA